MPVHHSITSSARAMSDGGTSRPRALEVLRLIARCNGYTKIEPTLGEALMTKTLKIAPPGYVYYPAYWEPLPGANCYWSRIPAYDAHGNMVGWRGRPEAFCSWLAGYRPWPLR